MADKATPGFCLPATLLGGGTEAEAFFRAILDCIEDGIKIVNRKFEVIYANRTSCERAGHGLESLASQKCYHAFRDSTHPCLSCPLDRAIRENEISHGSYTVRDKEGRGHTFEISVYPFRTARGEDLYITVSRDITQRKALEEQLVHSTRLASLGEIAAGIAHEVRNPLQSIRLGLDAVREAESPGERDDAISRISSDITRLNHLVTQLLDFTRKREERFEEIRPEHPVERAIFYVRKTCIEREISIVREWEEELPTIEADPDLLTQVFLNVVLNAIQAMPDGGSLRIEIQNPGTGHEIEFIFEDTGPGISEADFPHVFNPFFSTKPDGTGLGLPTSQRILSEHGGTIDLFNRPGEGLRVNIRLPRRAPGGQTRTQSTQP